MQRFINYSGEFGASLCPYLVGMEESKSLNEGQVWAQIGTSSYDPSKKQAPADNGENIKGMCHQYSGNQQKVPIYTVQKTSRDNNTLLYSSFSFKELHFSGFRFPKQ